MKKESLDRDKLRRDIRKLRRDDLLSLLDRAIDQIPKTRLPKVFQGIVDPKKKKNNENISKEFLSEIKLFYKASLNGKYYEDFNVNSKNYMNKSSGTKKWISECNRLFNLCVSNVSHSCKDVRDAMLILFGLLRRIDEGDSDFVFFADEAGSWQVGVDWDRVLPAWFRCLSEMADSDEFAEETVRVIEDYVEYDREKFLTIARKKANPEQRKALLKKI